MKNFDKYAKQFIRPHVKSAWIKKDALDAPPIWCSSDLRDGNQALLEPMSPRVKSGFFHLLVALGFKEIEVGFPSSSIAEFEFVQNLIQSNLIPDDVTIQVLSFAREDLLARTFEAIKGAKNVIINVCNPVSVAQCTQVFKGEKEVKRIAVNATSIVKEFAQKRRGVKFEYTPESFSQAKPEFALEVCNAVLDVWTPDRKNKIIINLPATVETAMPHVFADQVEYISTHLKYRENVILSVHPHNDRGEAVSACELALLAGAERVEGTLFGNGERAGNVDLINLALNLFSHGIDPKLNLENIPYVSSLYTHFTGQSVPQRLPYSGELAFTAFAGSHQDAIAKGLKYRIEKQAEGQKIFWNVPYLPIDPRDVGRNGEQDVIRITSQSGKGGVAYVFEHEFSIVLPTELRDRISEEAKKFTNESGKEIKSEKLYSIFETKFLNNRKHLSLREIDYRNDGDTIEAILAVKIGDTEDVVKGQGLGRIDAACNAVSKHLGLDYTVVAYEQHMLGEGSSAKTIAYLKIRSAEKSFWGAGIHSDSISAAVQALCSAVNNLVDQS